MPAVGGFVFDSSGAPIDREIRVYRRDTGAFLGKTRSSGGGGDPHFDKVSLLLHMDGADGSTTFTDSSAAPKELTRTGSVQISTLRGMSQGASAYFTGGKLTASSGEFAFGTGDFTIEFLLYRDSTQWLWGGIFAIGGIAGLSLRIAGGSNTLNFIHSSSTQFSATNAYVRVGAWDHVAVCRYSGTTSVYINGVLGGSGSHTQNHTSTSLEIGGNAGQDANLVGYIDEFRITKGVARYTANFTPPAAPLPDIFGPGRTMAFGEYYFATPHTGEVNVVCLDDDSAPLENDLILRTFPV